MVAGFIVNGRGLRRAAAPEMLASLAAAANCQLDGSALVIEGHTFCAATTTQNSQTLIDALKAANLSQEELVALAHYRFDHLTLRETAEKTAVSHETVRERVASAERKLELANIHPHWPAPPTRRGRPRVQYVDPRKLVMTPVGERLADKVIE